MFWARHHVATRLGHSVSAWRRRAAATALPEASPKSCRSAAVATSREGAPSDKRPAGEWEHVCDIGGEGGAADGGEAGLMGQEESGGRTGCDAGRPRGGNHRGALRPPRSKRGPAVTKWRAKARPPLAFRRRECQAQSGPPGPGCRAGAQRGATIGAGTGLQGLPAPAAAPRLGTPRAPSHAGARALPTSAASRVEMGRRRGEGGPAHGRHSAGR